MTYSFVLFITKPQCLPALDFGRSAANALDVRRASTALQLENALNLATKNRDELLGLNLELPFLTSKVAGLPDGPTKDEAATELRHATERRADLLDPTLAANPIDASKREFELGQLQVRFAEATSYVAQLQAHHDGLAA